MIDRTAASIYAEIRENYEKIRKNAEEAEKMANLAIVISVIGMCISFYSMGISTAVIVYKMRNKADVPVETIEAPETEKEENLQVCTLPIAMSTSVDIIHVSQSGIILFTTVATQSGQTRTLRFPTSRRFATGLEWVPVFLR